MTYLDIGIIGKYHHNWQLLTDIVVNGILMELSLSDKLERLPK